MILQLSILCVPPNHFFMHTKGLPTHYYSLMCSIEVLFYCCFIMLTCPCFQIHRLWGTSMPLADTGCIFLLGSADVLTGQLIV